MHGVGGATPERMLGDPRTTRIAGDATAGLYRRTDDADAERRSGKHRDRTVPEAYCWCNLTSGDSSRALWLLLLPFMVVNLAHWTRPATRAPRPRATRAYDLLVRLAALSLTVLLVAAACEICLDLVAWQCLGTEGCAEGRWWLEFAAAERDGWWSDPGRRLALAAAVPGALCGLLWWLSHRTWIAYESQRPPLPRAAAGPGPARDPAGRPALARPGFWYGRRLVARLRAAHTAAAFLTVAAALLLPALRHDRAHGGAARWLGLGLAGLLAVLAGCVLLLVERSGRSEDEADEVSDGLGVTWLPGFALGATALTAVYTAAGREGWESSGQLPGGGLFPVLAVVQGGLVLALALVARRLYRTTPQPRTVLRGLAGPTVATLACALGGLLTAGAAGRAADWADRGTASGGALPGPPVALVWQAAAVPPVLLALLAPVPAVLIGYRRARAREAGAVRVSHPGQPEQPARTRQIARAVARARLTESAPVLAGTAALAAFLLGAAAVAAAAATGETPKQAAEQAPAAVRELVRLSQWLGSWLIGAAVLALAALGRRAYKDASCRRTVGILWDVGTFWPRAAHPFAPPCYAERAVPDLTWRIVTWTARPGRRLVLSGHSQGSVLAAAAAWQLDGPTRARTALLTYGSPLERLYGRWFPAYLGPGALDALAGQLRAWKNLWRRTDPIGGPVRVAPAAGAPPVDADPLPDPAAYGRTEEHPLPAPVLGHGEYRADPAFAVARAALLERLLPAAPGARAPAAGPPGPHVPAPGSPADREAEAAP
ncbi:hypothetical protein GCM10027168_54200 [Streptomyces capparidis]